MGEAFCPLLVDWDTAKAITGGKDRCSEFCMNEVAKDYEFVDKARFKL